MPIQSEAPPAPPAPQKRFEQSSHTPTGSCINPLKQSDIFSVPATWKPTRRPQRQKQAGNSQSLKNAKGLTIHIEIALDTSPTAVRSIGLTEPLTSHQACRKTGDMK